MGYTGLAAEPWETARKDLQRKADELADTRGAKLVSYEIVNGLIAHAGVPLQSVIDRAKQKGYAAFVADDGRLYVAAVPKPRAK